MADARAEATSVEGPGSGMIRDCRKRNAANQKRISKASDNNLDLQIILIGEIEKYERVTQKRGGGIGNISDVVEEATQKNTKVEIKWDECPAQAPERWQWACKKWGPALITRLVMFCDPSMRVAIGVKAGSKSKETQQILEFAWDLQFAAADGDYNASAEKGNGLRLLIEDLLQTGTVDWNNAGVYFLTKPENDVLITNRFAKVPKKVDEDHIGNMGWAKIRIAEGWSQTEALMVTDKDEVKCATFFPALKRSLGRVNSQGDPVAAIGRAKCARLQSAFSSGSKAPPKGASPVPKAKAAKAAAGSGAAQALEGRAAAPRRPTTPAGKAKAGPAKAPGPLAEAAEAGEL
ncbi:unnamed protein product [Prorocentrum cordatum]|uniref:FACT complex subunit n=1 Tax=Prorocentrum cordatum TaxID=2364126 RepID=A0ABN9RQY6_9DINO|nr:unnamed protein product [Polarella glacialis]